MNLSLFRKIILKKVLHCGCAGSRPRASKHHQSKQKVNKLSSWVHTKKIKSEAVRKKENDWIDRRWCKTLLIKIHSTFHTEMIWNNWKITMSFFKSKGTHTDFQSFIYLAFHCHFNSKSNELCSIHCINMALVCTYIIPASLRSSQTFNVCNVY